MMKDTIKNHGVISMCKATKTLIAVKHKLAVICLQYIEMLVESFAASQFVTVNLSKTKISCFGTQVNKYATRI